MLWQSTGEWKDTYNISRRHSTLREGVFVTGQKEGFF